MKLPLVSIVITTKNEEKNIETCLISIKKQTYKNIQIIVVDNNSTDNTKSIAKKYTRLVYDKGPERSAQRNYGAKKADGIYLLFLDADMKLSKYVVNECVTVMEKEKIGGVIIPEESYGIGFWSQCKKLERSFYIGNKFIEAARFYSKKAFLLAGGFDESLTGPEDWDLSQRISRKYKVDRIHSLIFHNEGKLSLKITMQKKYYYAKKIGLYINKSENRSDYIKQLSLIERYKIFFTEPKKMFKNPFIAIGMLVMKTGEFIAVGLGIINARIRNNL